MKSSLGNYWLAEENVSIVDTNWFNITDVFDRRGFLFGYDG